MEKEDIARLAILSIMLGHDDLKISPQEAAERVIVLARELEEKACLQIMDEHVRSLERYRDQARLSLKYVQFTLGSLDNDLSTN